MTGQKLSEPDDTFQDTETVAELSHGQRVRDRESDDDNQMLVLKIRALTSAREHHIDDTQTVAKANPDYPPSDPVIDTALVADIEDELGLNWEADDAVELYQDDQLSRVRISHYPVSCLAFGEKEAERR